MRKVFVGRVSNRISDQELKEMFEKYGKVSHVHMKQNFAFVHFENEREAEEAVKALDGTRVAGESLIVEFAKSEFAPPRTGGPSFDHHHHPREKDMMPPRFREEPPPFHGGSGGSSRYGDRFDDRERERYYSRSEDSLRMDRERSSRYDRDDRRSYAPYPPPRGYSPVGWREDRPPSYSDYRGRPGREPSSRYPEQGYFRRDDQYQHDFSFFFLSRPRRPVVCFICGNPDHKAAYCPERRSGSPPPAHYHRYNASPMGRRRSRSPPPPPSSRQAASRQEYPSSVSNNESSSGASSWSNEPSFDAPSWEAPSGSASSHHRQEELRSPSPVAQFYEDS